MIRRIRRIRRLHPDPHVRNAARCRVYVCGQCRSGILPLAVSLRRIKRPTVFTARPQVKLGKTGDSNHLLLRAAAAGLHAGLPH